MQLFIAHQTYGNKQQKESVDQDMRRLLWQYRHYPVFLVCSWMAFNVVHQMGRVGVKAECSESQVITMQILPGDVPEL